MLTKAVHILLWNPPDAHSEMLARIPDQLGQLTSSSRVPEGSELGSGISVTSWNTKGIGVVLFQLCRVGDGVVWLLYEPGNIVEDVSFPPLEERASLSRLPLEESLRLGRCLQ